MSSLSLNTLQEMVESAGQILVVRQRANALHDCGIEPGEYVVESQLSLGILDGHGVDVEDGKIYFPTDRYAMQAGSWIPVDGKMTIPLSSLRDFDDLQERPPITCSDIWSTIAGSTATIGRHETPQVHGLIVRTGNDVQKYFLKHSNMQLYVEAVKALLR